MQRRRFQKISLLRKTTRIFGKKMKNQIVRTKFQQNILSCYWHLSRPPVPDARSCGTLLEDYKCLPRIFEILAENPFVFLNRVFGKNVFSFSESENHSSFSESTKMENLFFSERLTCPWANVRVCVCVGVCVCMCVCVCVRLHPPVREWACVRSFVSVCACSCFCMYAQARYKCRCPCLDCFPVISMVLMWCYLVYVDVFRFRASLSPEQ